MLTEVESSGSKRRANSSWRVLRLIILGLGSTSLLLTSARALFSSRTIVCSHPIGQSHIINRSTLTLYHDTHLLYPPAVPTCWLWALDACRVAPTRLLAPCALTYFRYDRQEEAEAAASTMGCGSDSHMMGDMYMPGLSMDARAHLSPFVFDCSLDSVHSDFSF
jgi:hypothetical protein